MGRGRDGAERRERNVSPALNEVQGQCLPKQPALVNKSYLWQPKRRWGSDTVMIKPTIRLAVPTNRIRVFQSPITGNTPASPNIIYIFPWGSTTSSEEYWWTRRFWVQFPSSASLTSECLYVWAIRVQLLPFLIFLGSKNESIVKLLLTRDLL